MDGVRTGLPFTLSTIQVEHSLKGSNDRDDTVVVWQEGARGMPAVTSTTFELLDIEARYLLFLAPGPLPRTLRSCGGPQGIYEVAGNTVRRLGAAEEDGAVGLAGRSLDQAEQLIATALR